MNSLELSMTLKTTIRELKALNVMNNSRSLMKWSTLGHELKALDAMNSLELWITLANMAHELCALNAMVDLNDSRLWVPSFRCYEQLRVVDDIKDSRS